MKLTSSPHLRRPLAMPKLMLLVILCCIPAIVAQAYFFGFGNVIQIVIACSVALLTEALVLKLRKMPLLATLKDNSALLTGLLIGVALPAHLAWWITVIGALFAILVVKHLYGGLGQNLFNPAMAAYVLLLVSFPAPMTYWHTSQSQAQIPSTFTNSFSLIFTGEKSQQFNEDVDGATSATEAEEFDGSAAAMSIDATTSATPLDYFKNQIKQGETASQIQTGEIYGSFAAAGWEWVNLGFLIGGIFLVFNRLVAWQIPAGFLFTLGLFAALGYLIDPASKPFPTLHLFGGATMLGAFFIATDPVTASTTAKGRLIYGALIGGLVYAIRTWGGYPDGVAFAVILANMCVCLIDYYTQPKPYGHKGAA